MRDIFETAKIRDLIFMYSGVFAINGCKECIGKLTQYEKNIPLWATGFFYNSICAK